MYYISMKCGSGKGLYMNAKIKEGVSKGERHIVVQTTKILLEQFKVYLDELNPLLLVSTDDQYESILPSISEALQNDDNKVVMITDKCFYRLETYKLKGWKVWIDDCTKSFDLFIRGICEEDKEAILSVYEKLFITSDDFMEISGYENDPVNKKYKSVQLNDDFILSADTKILHSFYKNLSYYHEIAVLNDSLTGDVNQLVIAGWYDLSRYVDNSIDITYLANDFESSLLFKRWSHLFEEIHIEGDFEKINANDSRIDVKYFFEVTKTDSGLSKEQLKKNTTNIQKVRKWLADNVAKDSYIWTTNNECSFDLPGKKLPVVTRGLNEYTEYNTCIFIAAMNAHPQSDVYLNELFEFTREDILQEYETEQFYQFVYRSCIRNYESKERCTVYVYDSGIANSIPAGSIEYIDIGLSSQKKKRGPVSRVEAPKELLMKFKNWKNKWNGRADTFIRFEKWVVKVINKYPDWEEEDFGGLRRQLSV